MGKMKENPRYKVLSFRVTEDELAEIESVMIGGSRNDFLRDAVLKQAREDDQRYKSMATAKQAAL
jgi:hypothetical protein